MIHTFLYQNVVLEKECKTTYRKSVSALPHIPDSVFDEQSPKAGFEVVDVRYDLDKCEMHVVLEDRVIEDPRGIPAIKVDAMMQAHGWQRAPRDPRYCIEVEMDLAAFPHASSNPNKTKPRPFKKPYTRY
jgi:hypothetical protein